jgi:hypothetical protein
MGISRDSLKIMASRCEGNAELLKDLGQFKQSFPAIAGWRTIGERKIWFKSKMEANYARYLQFLKCRDEILDWEYEPKTFWFDKIKRGTRAYLPDFQVWTCRKYHHWIEVKGYMDARSFTKIKRFRKYYPQEVLMVIDSKWFAENLPKLRGLIDAWE